MPIPPPPLLECCMPATHPSLEYSEYIAELKVTVGQWTMFGLITDLTGQTLVVPVILTGHCWIQTFYFPYSCRLMLYNTAMISFFFGLFCCFALNPSKEKNITIN